jgi:hypothetical protein
MKMCSISTKSFETKCFCPGCGKQKQLDLLKQKGIQLAKQLGLLCYFFFEEFGWMLDTAAWIVALSNYPSSK